MSINTIRALVQTELNAVDQLIAQQLDSPIELINQVGQHIIKSGGKRLRPMVVLLGARAFGHSMKNFSDQSSITLAAVIELMHTATLLHDDVVDASLLRRGQKTANAIWGNAGSVLVGDFLYARSFQMMVGAKNLSVIAVISKATSTIVEGEVLQLLNCHNPDATEKNYLDIIYCKTGALFEAAAQLGPVICDQSTDHIKAMAAYGRHLGIAFQLIDDMLDYKATESEIGKQVGDDLAEGKVTLPLLHALREGSAAEKALIRSSIEQGSREHLADILQIIESTGGVVYTHHMAQQQVTQAREFLLNIPSSPYHDALHALATFAIERKH